MRSFLLTLAAAATMLVSLAGCSTNAATGKSSLMLLSREDEIALGAEAAPQMTDEFGGKVPNDRLQKYVVGVGSKLAKETESYNPTLPWSFTLLNSDVVNAFALPGGKVFITRGLASQLTSEAQMAGVLGRDRPSPPARQPADQPADGFNDPGGPGDRRCRVRRKQLRSQVRAVRDPRWRWRNVVLFKYGRDQEPRPTGSACGTCPTSGTTCARPAGVIALGGSKGATARNPSTHRTPRRARTDQEPAQVRLHSTQGNLNYQDYKDRYKTEFNILAAAAPKPKQMRSCGADERYATLMAHPEGWRDARPRQIRLTPPAEDRAQFPVAKALPLHRSRRPDKRSDLPSSAHRYRPAAGR
jgi:hypothetical protein